MHKEVEVYLDDMIAKSRVQEDHLTYLRKILKCLREYDLKLNPNNYVFGATLHKLLGILVSHRGIEIDPSKITTITKTPAPRIEKKVSGFLCHVSYIGYFIAKLTIMCKPLQVTSKE